MSRKKQHFLTRNNAASHTEFLHYAHSLPMRDLRQILQRHQKTIQRWLDGTAVIPPWAIAVLKLMKLEHQLIRDQMGYTAFEREYRQQQRPKQPDIRPQPAANDASFVTPYTWSQLQLEITQHHG